MPLLSDVVYMARTYGCCSQLFTRRSLARFCSISHENFIQEPWLLLTLSCCCCSCCSFIVLLLLLVSLCRICLKSLHTANLIFTRQYCRFSFSFSNVDIFILEADMLRVFPLGWLMFNCDVAYKWNGFYNGFSVFKRMRIIKIKMKRKKKN